MRIEAVAQAARRHWVALAAATVVTIIYLLPQCIQGWSGGGWALLLQEDETFYVARLARALQGRADSSPLIYEHRNEVSVVPNFVELALAFPFRCLHAVGVGVPSTASVLLFYRGVFAFGGVLAMVFAWQQVGMKPALAVLATLWIYLDAGTTSFKPLVGMGFTTHILARFPNPAVYLPVSCLAWGSYARVALGASPTRRAVFGTGLLVGLVFYTTFYYWTFLLAAVGLTTLVDLRRRWRASTAIVVVALVTSAFYWHYAFEVRAHELYTAVLWRTNFLGSEHGVSFASNKTLWLFALCAVMVHRVGTPGSRFLATSVVACLLVYYSALVTGLRVPNSMQATHWNVCLVPLTFAACLWYAARVLERSRIGRHSRRVGYAFAALLVCAGSVNFVRLSRHLEAQPRHGAGPLPPGYAAAFEWVKDNTDTDAVIVSGERTMAHIPFEAGRYLYVSEVAYGDPIPFEETLDRFRVLWTLQGKSGDRVRAELSSRWQGPGTWLWSWGLPRALVAELEGDGWPPLTALHWRRFVDGVCAAVDATTRDELREIAERHRMDYLVRGPEEPELQNAEKYLELTEVHRAEGVRIDRIDRWR